MNFITSILEQGLIYGILALGIYITYKILDFPDLTVDGSFPLGAAITAALLTRGMNPYITLILSFLAGAVAGICTGLIHVKCKVRDLLSGIIMMTALWTINLYIAGTANVPLFSQKTIFKNDLMDKIIPDALVPYSTLIIILVLAVICKVLLDLYLNTKSGFLLRAVGDNDVLVVSLAKDKGNIKILGLAISNGLVALAGCVFAQEERVFEISMGTGAMVIGLASVIIGTSIFRKLTLLRTTTAVLIGSIIYKACVAIALRNFDPQAMKLVTAVLFLIVLIISMERKKKVNTNVLEQSKCAVLFYDYNQVVGPSGIDYERFEEKMRNPYKKHTISYFTLATQMRVQGGNDYIAFIKDLLAGVADRKYHSKKYDLKLYSDFSKFEKDMYVKEEETGLSRMVAGYAWPWISKNDRSKKDIEIQGVKRMWNHCTEGWVHTGEAIDEVGCIHSIQGYDLNYAFVILGNDIGYDKTTGQIIIRSECYFDKNGKITASYEELKEYITNVYYVLMTRGIKGTYLYVCDDELREYFSKYIEEEN